MLLLFIHPKSNPVLIAAVAPQRDPVAIGTTLGRVEDANEHARAGFMQSSDAKRYRTLAEEARRHAADMRDDDCKQMMFRIAREYEELARRAEWLVSRKVDGRSESSTPRPI